MPLIPPAREYSIHIQINLFEYKNRFGRSFFHNASRVVTNILQKQIFILPYLNSFFSLRKKKHLSYAFITSLNWLATKARATWRAPVFLSQCHCVMGER